MLILSLINLKKCVEHHNVELSSKQRQQFSYITATSSAKLLLLILKSNFIFISTMFESVILTTVEGFKRIASLRKSFKVHTHFLQFLRTCLVYDFHTFW